MQIGGPRACSTGNLLVVIVTFKMPVVHLRKCWWGILPFASNKFSLPLAKSSYNLSQCALEWLLCSFRIETRAGRMCPHIVWSGFAFSLLWCLMALPSLFSYPVPLLPLLFFPLLFFFLLPHPHWDTQLCLGESLSRNETLKDSIGFRPDPVN